MRTSRQHSSLMLLTAACLILPACGDDSSPGGSDAAVVKVDAPTTPPTIDAGASDVPLASDVGTRVDVPMASDTSATLDGEKLLDGSLALDVPAPVDTGSSVDVPAPVDVSASDLAAAEANPAGACNALVNSAPVIQEEAQSGAPATLTGGTIVEGTYHRTATIYFGSTKGRYVKETIRLTKVSDTVYKMEFVSATATTNPPSPDNHVNVQLTLTGGANLDYNIVCGTTGTIATTYEANATTFRLRLGPDLVYTRQP